MINIKDNRILLQKVESPEKSEGFILPKSSQEETGLLEIVHMNKYANNGFSIGDIVVLEPYGGVEVAFLGEEFILSSPDKIICTITK